MSSFQHLREFISERLTAAAEEIFTEFEKTIVQYEEEMDRQRRLLDITWKPDTHLQAADVLQQRDCKVEEVLVGQQHLKRENSSPDLDLEELELPQIKEEEEEACNSEDEEQLVLKQETDTFIITPVYIQSDTSESEPSGDRLVSQNSSEAESGEHERSRLEDSGSAREGDGYQGNGADGGSPAWDSQSNPGTSSYSCDVCGKAFRFRSLMERHQIIHTGEKPFSCKICGKSFTQRSSLNVHVRIHTDEKPYSCKMCGKGFTRKSHLNSHIRTHLGQKWY